MKLLRHLLALLLVGQTLPAVSQAAGNSAVQSPLLWRIEGDTPAYLFGTIHIPDPRVTTLHPEVEQAFTGAEVVITELKMDMSTMTTAAQAMLLPAPQKLSTMLDAGQRAQLESELKAISPQLKLALFERLKPWALATQLALLPMQMKHPGVPALDLQLAQRAEVAGKRNEGLEQVQEQLGIFDGLNQAEQLALMQETLDGLAKARRTGKNIVELLTEAYLSGEEAKVEALLKEFQGENTALNQRLTKALIEDRNRTMTTRIIAKLKAQPSTRHFVAVGAAHLTGPTSIVALLRQQGYTVTRIR
ncbi:MAG TPA: TraB/GumN family protein [Permianibacter sp.]|nr:TraB/GumN family protein [Permianibacter sp.]